MSRQVSDAMKKKIAGKQHFKCNNQPNSNLFRLTNYKCPLWQKNDPEQGFLN